jgi:hypothetical protein
VIIVCFVKKPTNPLIICVYWPHPHVLVASCDHPQGLLCWRVQ